MLREYEVGDIVTIKSLEKIKKISTNNDGQLFMIEGKIYFNNDMINKCGRQYEIQRKSKSRYNSEIRYELKDADWLYTADMFEDTLLYESLVIK